MMDPRWEEEAKLVQEERQEQRKPSKKAKKAAEEAALRSQKIAANVAVEQAKRAQIQKKRQRKDKDKRMRQRTKSGNVVMKNVIGDLLQKIEKAE
jgi:hypothetical protein